MSSQTLSDLPVTRSILLFNACLVIKVFSSSATLLQRIAGMGEDLVFNYIAILIITTFPQHSSKASVNMPPGVALYSYTFLWREVNSSPHSCLVAQPEVIHPAPLCRESHHSHPPGPQADLKAVASRNF